MFKKRYHKSQLIHRPTKEEKERKSISFKIILEENTRIPSLNYDDAVEKYNEFR